MLVDQEIRDLVFEVTNTVSHAYQKNDQARYDLVFSLLSTLSRDQLLRMVVTMAAVLSGVTRAVARHSGENETDMLRDYLYDGRNE